MNNNYKIKDILSAIDALLDNKEKKTLELVDQVEKPLILKNESKILTKKVDSVPKSTEKIILQAEKYLKK
tara:strand:- start:616 stop:825 length:210 start_codon:yes stop_codon:yes gene_type:complete